MATWIAELPVHIDCECEVTGFVRRHRADVRLSDGEPLLAQLGGTSAPLVAVALRGGGSQ